MAARRAGWQISLQVKWLRSIVEDQEPVRPHFRLESFDNRGNHAITATARTKLPEFQLLAKLNQRVPDTIMMFRPDPPDNLIFIPVLMNIFRRNFRFTNSAHARDDLSPRTRLGAFHEIGPQGFELGDPAGEVLVAVGISFDQIRTGGATPGSSGPGGGGMASDWLSGSGLALFSACQAAIHRTWNSLTFPLSALTISSREGQRGTLVSRNTLWTVEELIWPRPARDAIARIEGKPAAMCSSSRREKRSATGPGGAGPRRIAVTLTILLPVQGCPNLSTDV